MALGLVLAQIVLPLGLLAWLALAPAKSAVGYVVQAAGTGLALLAVALAGMWVMPPWWTPYLYGLLWVAALVLRFQRSGFAFDRLFPSRLLGWTGLVLIGALGALGGFLAFEAVQGRRLPDAPVADIPFPLGPGIYLVAHGGSRPLINPHMKTLDPDVERFRAYRGQSFAIDVLKIDGLGLRADGWRPEDPAAYEIFGERVIAPCDGTVVSSRNDLPDMRVPVMDRDNLLGNHVLLNCGDFALLLAHFRQASVRVQTGDRVNSGDLLGEVGNSGNSSEPHLHLHAQRLGLATRPISGQPMALTIDGRYPVRNDRFRVDGWPGR